MKKCPRENRIRPRKPARTTRSRSISGIAEAGEAIRNLYYKGKREGGRRNSGGRRQDPEAEKPEARIQNSGARIQEPECGAPLRGYHYVLDDAERFRDFAACLEWRESERWDAAEWPSRFRAASADRERLADGLALL